MLFWQARSTSLAPWSDAGRVEAHQLQRVPAWCRELQNLPASVRRAEHPSGSPAGPYLEPVYASYGGQHTLVEQAFAHSESSAKTLARHLGRARLPPRPRSRPPRPHVLLPRARSNAPPRRSHRVPCHREAPAARVLTAAPLLSETQVRPSTTR